MKTIPYTKIVPRVEVAKIQDNVLIKVDGVGMKLSDHDALDMANGIKKLFNPPAPATKDLIEHIHLGKFNPANGTFKKVD